MIYIMSIYDSYMSFPGNNNTWGGTKFGDFKKKLLQAYKRNGLRKPSASKISQLYKSPKCGRKGYITGSFRNLCKNPITSQKKKKRPMSRYNRFVKGYLEMNPGSSISDAADWYRRSDCSDYYFNCKYPKKKKRAYMNKKKGEMRVPSGYGPDMPTPDVMKQLEASYDPTYGDVYGPEMPSEDVMKFLEASYDPNYGEAPKKYPTLQPEVEEFIQLYGDGLYGGCAVCRGTGVFGGCRCCGMGMMGGIRPRRRRRTRITRRKTTKGTTRKRTTRKSTTRRRRTYK